MEIAGSPPASRIALTCLGGYLSAGGAGAVNHYWDRDIDAQMTRTASRPIPAGRISPRAALTFGFVLATMSFVLLSLTVNVLAASLALGGFVGYVGVYTMYLKRRTPQNIVIGGAAGAVPPLVGWAATRGSLSWTAVYLFAIVFYWTPPHFWALSLLIQKDYEKAKIPMLPVVMGEQETRKQILLYSLLLLAVTMILFAMGAMGYFYLVTSLILGGILLYMAIRLFRDKTKSWARTLFWYSNCYLALIFAVMVIDRVIPY
jgi:protoheme IX farnesyltransferase